MDTLLELKALDDRRLAIEDEIRSIDQEMQNIDQTIRSGSSDVAEVEAAIAEKQKERDKLDLDAKSMESHINRLKGQLLEVKTNREYETMRGEIEKEQAAKSRIEDKILQLMVDIDTLKDTLARARNAADSGKTELEKTRQECVAKRENLKESVKELEAARNEKVKELPADIASMYERILALRGDTAVAEADPETRVCQGCYSTITLQKVSLLMLGKELVQCENCNRFLYLPREADKAAQA